MDEVLEVVSEKVLEEVPDDAADDVEGQHSGYFRHGTAYVTNTDDATVSVIDLNRAREIKRIAVGNRPLGVAVSPDKRFVYVANTDDGTLSVIDALRHTVVATVDLNAGPFVGTFPVGVAVSPDGRFVYVANFTSENVSVVDARQLVLVTEIPLSARGQEIRVTPDGNLAYVTMSGVGTGFVGVLDLNANLQVKTIDTCGLGQAGLDLARTRPLVYFGCTGILGTIGAINTDLAEQSLTSIILSSSPDQIAFNPSGSIAYVTELNGDELWVVDVFRHTQVLTITVGDGSRGVKVTDNGLLVVVTNEGDDSVSIVDARTNTVAATVPVGGGPTHVDIA